MSIDQHRRRLLLGAALALSALLPLGSAGAADRQVRVGISSGETEDVWTVVRAEAAKRGLDVVAVPFNDYTQPNEALESGDLDANAFQHQPYLDNQNKARGYHIVPVGYTALWPIGLYSRKHKSVADLPKGAVIGLPNDPSNEGRALRLLQSEGLITLKPEAGILATAADITGNPKALVVKELDAGIVGRSIDDLDAAVVNTDWALKSGLGDRERIAREPVADNPYRNLIAVEAGHEDDPWVKPLVASFQTDAVRASLDKVFKGTAVAAW